jgi:hypothetical protein
VWETIQNSWNWRKQQLFLWNKEQNQYWMLETINEHLK